LVRLLYRWAVDQDMRNCDGDTAEDIAISHHDTYAAVAAVFVEERDRMRDWVLNYWKRPEDAGRAVRDDDVESWSFGTGNDEDEDFEDEEDD